MAVDFQTYINHARTSHTRSGSVRLEFVEMIGTELVTTGEITADLLPGSSLDIVRQNGIRRHVSLNLINIEKKYVPDVNGRIWFSKYFKLFTGLIIDGQLEETNQGLFAFTNPSVESNFSRQIASVEAYDFGILLNGELNGNLEFDNIIPVGSNIATFLRQTLARTTVPTKSIANIDRELEGITTPFTIEIDAGETFLDIFEELANAYGYEFYFDVDGIFNFLQPPDQTSQGDEWTFSKEDEDTDINYQTAKHNYQFNDMYNAFRVYGKDLNGNVITRVAEDNNVFSDTNVSLIGRKIAPVLIDENITTPELVQARADFEVSKSVEIWESIEITSVPLDHLDVGFIVIVNDTNAGLDRRRCIINAINLPLFKDTSMSLTVLGTRSITDTVLVE